MVGYLPVVWQIGRFAVEPQSTAEFYRYTGVDFVSSSISMKPRRNWKACPAARPSVLLTCLVMVETIKVSPQTCHHVLLNHVGIDWTFSNGMKIKLLSSFQGGRRVLTAFSPLAQTSHSSNKEWRPWQERWPSSPMGLWIRSRWEMGTDENIPRVLNFSTQISLLFCLLRIATAPTERHRTNACVDLPASWQMARRKDCMGKDADLLICPFLQTIYRSEAVFSSLVLISSLFMFIFIKKKHRRWQSFLNQEFCCNLLICWP